MKDGWICFIVSIMSLLSPVMTREAFHKVPTKETPSVMFWRPQKVGSSTILSLLVSYSFRYNIQSRPRDSANVLCSKIAKCALNSAEKFDNATTKSIEHVARVWKSRRGHLPPEIDSAPVQMSMSHEICNLPSKVVKKNLKCAFRSEDKPKEFIVVRNPLKRALSIYYFWGELWRMKNRIAEDRKQTMKKKGKGGGTGKRPPAAAQDLASPNTRLLLDLHDAQHGNTHISSPEAAVFQLGAPVKGEKIAPIRGGLFVYHGDELSPPPEDIAMAYATHIPLKKGMPGPSFTWSCYAQSVEEAIEGLQVQEKPNPLSLSAPLSLPQLQSYRISPVVTERLDESLIVLSSHLSWSVADLVNVMPRKSLSSHPPLSSWPPGAVRAMNESMTASGEWLFFEAANQALDQRIAEIKALESSRSSPRLLRKPDGPSFEALLSFEEKLHLLRALREKVTEYCLSPPALALYQSHLSSRLSPHPKGNKLRDVPPEYVTQGHCFSLGEFETELIYSFDVCSGCEAHSILWQLKEDHSSSGLRTESAELRASWMAERVAKAVPLSSWEGMGEARSSVDFQHCPTKG